MCVELVASYLVGEFFSFWIEKERYPTDVVLGRVRMSDLFAYRNFDFKNFIGFDCVCALDDWHVLL